MKLSNITLEDLLSEITELPGQAEDATTRKTVEWIPRLTARLMALGRPANAEELASLIAEDPISIDVFRLFMGASQDVAGHRICAQLGWKPCVWSALKKRARKDATAFAAGLVELGLAEKMWNMVGRAWTVNDLLYDRYGSGRGRAVSGQTRGRALEDAVERLLTDRQIPFERGVTFVGREDIAAKCDFAIPNRHRPFVVIEAKGFEATGSKLTDLLGDVLKIKDAKDYHTFFFVVTDGRGWFNRQSDLRALVDLHQKGIIDMIYTAARLPQLGEHINEIWQSRG